MRRPGPRSVVALLTVALTTVLGLQLLRVLFPLVGWYLRDTVGVGAAGLLPYAVVPVLLGLLVPVVARSAGAAPAVVTGAGLAIVRAAEQLTVSPRVDLWLAMGGVTLLLWTLSLLAARGCRWLGPGVLAGVAGDAVLRALGRTLDPSWHGGVWPSLTVLALSGLLVAVLAVRRPGRGPDGAPAARGLVAVGPVLLLELLVLANQGWIAEGTGWGWPAAAGLLVVSAAAGLATVGPAGRAAVRLPGGARTPAVAGGLLLVAAAVVAPDGGLLLAVAVPGGQVGAGMLLGAAVTARPEGDAPSPLRAGAAVVTGMLVLIAGAFAYYVGYDVAVGVSQPQVLVGTAVAALLAGAALPGRRPAAAGAPAPGGSVATTAAAVTAAAGAAVALAMPVIAPVPGPAPVDDPGLRVATYNVHSGFGTDGTQDLRSLAATIRDTGAEVVALQEVSRGWLLNGSTDLLGWLRRALGMPHAAFVATTDDPLWGNAVLSRRPLDDVGRGRLPELDTLIGRGWVSAEVPIPAGGVVQVVSTHLHHTGDLERIHAAQVAALLEDAPDPAVPTVLMGDLNARPGWPQVEQLLAAGYVDAWEEAGTGSGATANAADPRHRIDWILHEPGLRAVRAEVIGSRASDHLPVAASLHPAQ